MNDKTKTLRELVAMIEGVIRAGDDEDMPAEVIADTLEGLEWNLTEKTDAIAEFMRSCDARAAECRSEVKRLQGRAKAWDGKKSRLKAYTAFWLGRLNHAKIETATNSLAIVKGQPSVIIEDEEAIPDDYMVISKRPDKAVIKTLLKQGKDIPGCRLEEGGPTVRLT